MRLPPAGRLAIGLESPVPLQAPAKLVRMGLFVRPGERHRVDPSRLARDANGRWVTPVVRLA